jgi:A/G-specific adenine glycosylase
MDAEALRTALLEWYRPRRQAYAWRRGRRDPYRVLVSEVMLQQTQAARVEPIFEEFLVRFPDVGALAGSSRADVLRAWEGLGYNRRAVALHDAARTIVAEHGGRVPRDPEMLRRLPGVGPYTAAAIAAIACSRRMSSPVGGRSAVNSGESSPTTPTAVSS